MTIPEHELEYRFSPSGGPGGQHANKAATRAELTWNVTASEAVGPRQRHRILEALEHRIDSSGNLRLTSDRRRSQLQNRADVTERLRTMVSEALVPQTKRVDTKPTKASKERRLTQKRKRSEVKQKRRVQLDDF